MKILVLNYEFPPVGGGGGRVCADLARALAARGHGLQVITSSIPGLPGQAAIDGYTVRRVFAGRRSPHKASFLAMTGYIAGGFFPALGLALRWKPEIIHAHFAVPTGALAYLISRLSGIPYMLTIHLGDVPGGVPEKTGRWFRWILPFTKPIWHNAARVIAVSQFTRQLAMQHYPVEIEVIPNGVDLEQLNPGEIHIGDPPRIIFAGRFMPQKNPVQVVRVLAAIREVPWSCVLVGDGPLRQDVEREIDKYHLQRRLALTGWVEPEQVIEWLGKSDVLFMPSLTEGLPVVGVQALAMGLAMVGSEVGGCVELVRPAENGYLHAPDDTAGMAQSLRMLLTDPERLLRARFRSRQLAQRFDLAAVSQNYESLFERVVR